MVDRYANLKCWNLCPNGMCDKDMTLCLECVKRMLLISRGVGRPCFAGLGSTVASSCIGSSTTNTVGASFTAASTGTATVSLVLLLLLLLLQILCLFALLKDEAVLVHFGSLDGRLW